MMIDVTATLDTYRLAARCIWNDHIRRGGAVPDWDVVDQFDQIRAILFDILVGRVLDIECSTDVLFREPVPGLEVEPRSGGPMPIMIQRPSEQNRYWDEKVNEVTRGEVQLLFVDHFDWDRMAIADFQYYLVRIADFPAHPELVGRQALIEVHHAVVMSQQGPVAGGAK